MSSSVPVLCSFHTPVEPALVSCAIPEPLLQASRSLNGQVMPLDNAVACLREASQGVGAVEAEDGLISWEIRYSVADIANGIEQRLDLAERDDNSPDRAGIIWNEGESRWMTNAEVRQLLLTARRSDEVSFNFVVLIRYKPVGKLKAN